MKLLCTSDLHCRFDKCDPTTLPDADVLLVAGDLTETSSRSQKTPELLAASNWLRACAARYPHVLWVPGNHDIGVYDTLYNLPPNCRSVLRQVVEIEGVRFYGEALSCCFDKPTLAQTWSWMTADPRQDARVWENAPPADVIVSHSPPLNCRDLTAPLYTPGKGWERIALGSPGLRAYVERHLPRLVVCGHIHEAVGEGWIGVSPKTLVANVAERVDLFDMTFAKEVS